VTSELLKSAHANLTRARLPPYCAADTDRKRK